MSKENNNTINSESILQKRIKNFKKIKRAYYSFWILVTLYILSFFSPILISGNALMVKYNDSYSFPAFGDLFGGIFRISHLDGTDFGMETGPPNYRAMKEKFKAENAGNWVMMPPYPYGPNEVLLNELKEGETPPTKPSKRHIFGTDTQARDIFARAIYGFQISISFALIALIFSYMIGIILGGILGYFGGRVDLFGLRFIEVFSVLPFLFIIMILVRFIKPSFFMLAFLVILLRGWIGITYFVRAEFYREKARDYVAAANAMGQRDWKIMFKHILPNALTSVITFAPFAIIGFISSLVALDFLGFGLPVPTPSWGELIRQGASQDLAYWWIILTPLVLIFITLVMVTFIGEGVRQAFDPKEYSRLQ